MGVPLAFACLRHEAASAGYATKRLRRGSVPYGLRLRFGAAAAKAAAALALAKQRHPPGT